MYLGSCRYKLPTVEESPETYAQIFEMFESLNIGAFFYIGGNDSMDTALKLSQYAASIGSDVRVIGVPKTIDNDLCLTACITSHDFNNCYTWYRIAESIMCNL